MFDNLFEVLGLDDIFDDSEDYAHDDGVMAAEDHGDYGDVNGIVEYYDIDGDGIVDAEARGYDIDNDGALDEIISYVDTDGDGAVDTIIHSIDANEDGFQEDVFILGDSDGDGEIDTLIHEADTDGDGAYDIFDVIGGDDDDDDDPLDSDDDDDDDDPLDLDDDDDDDDDDDSDPFDLDDDDDDDDPLDLDDDDDIDVTAGSVDTYTPLDDSADDDFIIGDTDEAEDAWHVQESQDTCAVASQEFVLEMLTGEEFNENDLRDIAEENGWYTPGGGTSPEDVGNILEYFGLDVERSTGNDISDIEKCLENDGQVIVGVDSSELWTGEHDDFYFPGFGEIGDADHAIQVVGIDRSDEDNPMIIVNDSGVANGACAEVPLDIFMDAWEDSDCLLVEAYA